MQIAFKEKPAYEIELISEKFDRLKEEEKIKTIIHELMHIPHSFSGGFRVHKPFVTKPKVEKNYSKLMKKQTTK